METWGPLFEIVQFLDGLRGGAADFFGPLAPIVTGAGQILAAGVALVALIGGKSFWAPPTPGLSNFGVRICGLAGAVGVVALYVWSKNGGNAWDFIFVSFVAVCAGVVGAVLYLILRTTLFFRCDGDDALYIKGLWLKKYARRVLTKKLDGLPEQYELQHGDPPPTDSALYFCRSGKRDDFVWSPLSKAFSLAFLFLTYFLMIVPLEITLASASLAVSQPQIEIKRGTKTETLELPADVLFDFGKFEIRPGAAATLDRAAAIIREKRVTSARIEGHTDSVGLPDYNHKLSEQRSEAVRRWLIDKAGLVTVHFDVMGFGATHPVAPNKKQDGTDDREGRKKNRRVAILFETP
jgi:outer membrane protein OmpA-like peptidoglycan-associated protein